VSYDPGRIKHTVSAILHAQDETIAAGIVDSANAEITKVDYDFGNDIYALDLRISAVKFAQIEKIPRQMERAEKKIQEVLWKLGVDPEGSSLSRVRVMPELVVGPGAASLVLPTPTDENRIWETNRLRLFISHVSRIREPTFSLKLALKPLGIDAFVAHADIEANLKWRREVEFALRSMHAVCALITEDFCESQWCDQEVGYGLGRGVPVISVKYEKPPHGLMAENQAVAGNLSAPKECALKIFDVLFKQEQLSPVLIEGIVQSLEAAPNFAGAIASMKRMAAIEKNLSKEQILRMLAAARDNDQVRQAINVEKQILGIAKRAQVALPREKSARDDFADDIPF
jgi:hypothetical protein